MHKGPEYRVRLRPWSLHAFLTALMAVAIAAVRAAPGVRRTIVRLCPGAARNVGEHRAARGGQRVVFRVIAQRLLSET